MEWLQVKRTGLRLAVEGLPGTGKTTLINRIRASDDQIITLPEMMCEATDELSFLKNDAMKDRVMRTTDASRTLVMDRYWLSTYVYHDAARRTGRPAPSGTRLSRNYGLYFSQPDGWILAISESSVSKPKATDGYWSCFDFCAAVNDSYSRVLRLMRAPVVIFDLHRDGDEAFTRIAAVTAGKRPLQDVFLAL